ncbi:MAG TPA: sensor domain-containing diguanylate cyclase [Gemmatimonadaceae bacterium]
MHSNVVLHPVTEAAVLASVFAHLPQAMVIADASGRLLQANPAFWQLFDFDEAELTGGGHPVDERLAPLDRRLEAAALCGRVIRGERVEVNTVRQRRDGTLIDVCLRGLALALDAGTARICWTYIPLAQHQAERFHQLVTESTTDLVSVIGPDGTYRYLSPALVSTLGYEPAERIGQSCFDYIHPDDVGRIRAEFARGLSIPGPYDRRVEYRIRHKDGSYRVFESTGSNQLHSSVGGVVLHTRDITQRRQTEERLQRAALHDPLTGLPNRGLFLDRLGHRVTRAARDPEGQFAVLFLDLDTFKSVNDRHGHHAGDALLIGMARRLEQCVRAGDTVARLGGDEFTVLLDAVGGLDDAVAVANRMRDALNVPLRYQGLDLVPTASIGVSAGPCCADNADNILRNADRAMYRAKQLGGNRVEVFEEGTAIE